MFTVLSERVPRLANNISACNVQVMPPSLSALARQQFLLDGLTTNNSFLSSADATNNTQSEQIFLFCTAIVANLPTDTVINYVLVCLLFSVYMKMWWAHHICTMM
jgi:hypothetical protein